MLETMVTVTLVAVLMAMAAPGLSALVKNSRRDGYVLGIVGGLNFARSEAIRQGCHVKICPSSNGAQCAGNAHWETGWIVFADPNRNGMRDAGEQILRQGEAAAAGSTIRGSKHAVVYQGSGFSPGYMDTLKVCDDRGKDHARSIVINMPGRVIVNKGATVCP